MAAGADVGTARGARKERVVISSRDVAFDGCGGFACLRVVVPDARLSTVFGRSAVQLRVGLEACLIRGWNCWFAAHFGLLVAGQAEAGESEENDGGWGVHCEFCELLFFWASLFGDGREDEATKEVRNNNDDLLVRVMRLSTSSKVESKSGLGTAKRMDG